MQIEKFLTKFVLNHIDTYSALNLETVSKYADMSINELRKELRKDFYFVEWFIREIFSSSSFYLPFQTPNFLVYNKESESNDVIPILIYKFDNVFVKSYPTLTDTPYWDVWNWEYAPDWETDPELFPHYSTYKNEIIKIVNSYKGELPIKFLEEFEKLNIKFNE